jgi:hypothetical protein
MALNRSYERSILDVEGIGRKPGHLLPHGRLALLGNLLEDGGCSA